MIENRRHDQDQECKRGSMLSITRHAIAIDPRENQRFDP